MITLSNKTSIALLIALMKANYGKSWWTMGKKEGHIASLLNVSDITKFYNDDFLKSDYSIQTELNYDLEFILLRENYKNFEYTTVKTKRWAPIFIYFKPVDSNNWVLRLYTESSRINGDLKEFYKILDHIK